MYLVGDQFSFLSFSVPSLCLYSQALAFLCPTHPHQAYVERREGASGVEVVLAFGPRLGS